MSLTKKSCEHCWLPPDKDNTLCRKCRGINQTEFYWIRYHTPSADCKNFRSLIVSDTYYSAALPEKCIHCCNFLTGFPKWADALKMVIKSTTFNNLIQLFNTEKDALLDYITNLLTLFVDDHETSKRIISALLSLSYGKEKWMLEELVQRPILYKIFLNEPLLIPYHLTEDFYGYFEDVDVWWTFWEKMPAATRRRIRFRCMKIKEELLEKTWHPSRVLKWCLDCHELNNVERTFK